MALIECPECGKEISSLAPNCIHCGYPLGNMDARNADIYDLKRERIFARVEPICTELNKYRNLVQPQIRDSVVEEEINSIYSVVVGQSDDLIKEANDKAAEIIMELVHKYLRDHRSKPLVYSYYDLVRFDNLSPEMMRRIAETICQEIKPYSPPQYWNDGSRKTNSEYIIFWYPIYQIMTYGDDNIKSLLMNTLADDETVNSKGKKLEYINNQGRINGVWTPSSYEPPAVADYAVRCPRCRSTQIVTGQRGYSVVWGFMGSNKTMNRCANCGYKWEPRR